MRREKRRRGYWIVTVLVVVAVIGGAVLLHYLGNGSGKTAGTCSPRGTATCDGQGNPITPGGSSSGSGSAGVAAGVRILTDVGLQTIKLKTGGTNGLDVDTKSGLVYAVSNSTVGAWCGKSIGTRSDTVSVVDPVKGKEIAAVATEKGPVWPLVDPSRNAVYVAASAEGKVAVHEKGSGKKVSVINVGGLPHDLGLDPASNILLVSNTNNGSQRYVAAVDTKTRQVVGQHAVAQLPHRIAFDVAKRLAYIVSVDSGTISTFNTKTGQPTGSFATSGRGTMAFSSSLRRLFVPASGNATSPETIRAVNVDTKKVIGTISPFLSNAGHQAFGLTVDESSKLLYATLGDSNYVGVADATSLKPLAVFQVNDCPWGVRLDPARGRGYATNTAGGTLSVFSLTKINVALGR